MSGWLLDTDVISELRRPRPNARVRAFVAGQRLEELFVSTVTFAEIRYGIEAVSNPIRRAELNDWLAHKVRPMSSSRFGMQSDNVLEMEVVTGKGDKVTCSPNCNADLFDAVRAGLGQVGVITRATLKLIAAPQQVRRFLLIYPDLKTMLTDERLLAADNRFEAVQGAVLAEQALRANGQWLFPHPWLTTFVGDSEVESVVSDELAKLTPADLGTFGQVVLSAFRRQAVTSPLLSLPSDDLCYAFNLVRIPTTDDAAEANRLVTANRAIYERVRDAGGTLYPVSAFPMSRRDWRRHFGPAFERLAEAKRNFDPRHVLTPGYEVF